MIEYSIKSNDKYYFFTILFFLGIYRLQIKMRLFVELRLDQHTVSIHAGNNDNNILS